MFFLTNRMDWDRIPDRLALETDEALRRTDDLLNDASEGLRFEAEGHRYSIGGREIPSVSSIVRRFSPFDAEKAAAGASRNPKNPLFGKSVEEILSLWEDKRDKAAAEGSRIHAFAEACYLWRTNNRKQIAPEFRDRITADGFAALPGKEEAVARFYQELDSTRYAVSEEETALYNPELGYAGTFDLLLYDMREKRFLLRDYKTNGNLYKWYGDYLKAPLNFMRSDDIGRYTLQQNLYMIQLENIGINTGDMKLIWLKEDGSYEEVELKKMRPVIEYAVRTINDEIQNETI